MANTPIWGPLPCETTSSWARATVARWFSIVAGWSPRISALPPRATTTLTGSVRPSGQAGGEPLDDRGERPGWSLLHPIADLPDRHPDRHQTAEVDRGRGENRVAGHRGDAAFEVGQ